MYHQACEGFPHDGRTFWHQVSKEMINMNDGAAQD
jgi:hypothetical protein